MDNKYISFVRVEGYDKLYNIINKRSNIAIGALAIHPDTHTPSFYTGKDTVWNITCLSSVAEFMESTFSPENQTGDLLQFVQLPRHNKQAKTDRLSISHTPDMIKWFGNWRQYCLFSSETTYTKPHVMQIIDKLTTLKK